MAVNSMQIHFFSGTGNARFTAVTIASLSDDMVVPCNLVDLGKASRRNIPPPPYDSLIGFISPTHGFNFPPLMVNYILRFPRGHNRVFLMNTRAGMKLGKFFMPGLSGIALLLAAIILKLKGYKIVGMHSIDLPSNWISLHPGIRTKIVESIFIHCEKKIRHFASQIISGKRNYRALWDLPQDLLITPVSLGYYFVGRFLLAKSFVANNTCNSCGTCIAGCPVHAISEVAGRPYWAFTCESCMKCMNNCPHRSIETAHGLFFGLLFLGNFLQSLFLWRVWNHWLTDVFTGWWSSGFLFLVNFALSLLTFWLGYLLIHYLSALKPVAQMVRYTSLTTWRFWRRYKPVRMKRTP